MNNLIATIKHKVGLFHLMGALLLGGCIEGAGSLQLADGIGGTGITTGRLTGFGSVYVNGIHFNTDNAEFIRDGVSSNSQQDFSIGEIIRVEGKVNADRTTGTANKIIYAEALQGPVTQAADGRTLLVMGQMVVTDPLTVLHKFKRLTELKAGNIVEISGYKDAEGKIRATSIKLLSQEFTTGDFLTIEGTVSQLNVTAQTFNINELTVNYTQAVFNEMVSSELRDGLFLAITARQNINNDTMIAAEIIKLDDALETNTVYEIEGLVSYFMASGYFEVDGFPVSTNTSTQFINGSAADIDENSLLIVTGLANAQGIIVAESVQLLNYAKETYLEATISAIDQVNNTITILGQDVMINEHTLLSDDTTDDFVTLNLSQFAIGEAAYVVAYKNEHDDYIASRLSRIAPIEALYLSGQIQNPAAAQGQLELFGNTVISDANTQYFDQKADELTRSTFFSGISQAKYVGIIGTQSSNGFILAESMTLESE